MQMIVDFWATWCQPCVGIAPVFEALSAKYASTVFVKVDVDEMEVRRVMASAFADCDWMASFLCGWIGQTWLMNFCGFGLRQDITNEYAVTAMPTFKVFKGGKVVDELSGAIKSALESMVAKHAAA